MNHPFSGAYCHQMLSHDLRAFHHKWSTSTESASHRNEQESDHLLIVYWGYTGHPTVDVTVHDHHIFKNI